MARAFWDFGLNRSPLSTLMPTATVAESSHHSRHLSQADQGALLGSFHDSRYGLYEGIMNGSS
jgi:hypothetical protein